MTAAGFVVLEESAVNEIVIRDRGRGPELAGTRVTVFDIIPYLREGDHPTYIAACFALSTHEVEALIRYIEEHKEEVMAINAKIEERIARGNPPEIEEKLKKSPWHAIIKARGEEVRRRRAAEENHGTAAVKEDAVNEIVIRDRGRGPELARIRITVFDLIPYLRAGETPEEIADFLPISLDEVLALMKYIEDHKDEVMAMNAKIEERIARGNPPEVEEKLKKSRAKLMALREELERKKREQEANHAGDPCGRQYPGARADPLPRPVE